ncbi:MAG: pyridoxamine 5'-phosphate oxidase family protein, partial [Oleispira sp.]|nr:pyridoxamine 5'-phosphate oxidase family protein [Oleispira sp.]
MKKHDLEQEVAELLQREHHGMLSTFVTADCDDKAAGFPFGSVVRFVIGQSDQNKGAPILLLSRIAEHSKHIAQQNKASLLISETDAKKDIQQQARLTLLGTMRRLSI